MTGLTQFFWGASAMAAWIVGMIFFRSWRYTGDRFFVLSASAFWMLSLHWTALAVVGAVDETRPYFYLVRLLAFVVLLTAIAGKNDRHRETRYTRFEDQNARRRSAIRAGHDSCGDGALG